MSTNTFNNISGSIHTSTINNNYYVDSEPELPPLPPRIPPPPSYPPPPDIHNITNTLSQNNTPSRIINISSGNRYITNNDTVRNNDDNDDNDDNVLDNDNNDQEYAGYSSDINFIFNDIMDELDNIDNIAENNKEEYNHLYDCDDDIYHLNNYKNKHHKYFLNSINHLNKELHHLYKQNLKLNNDNYYLHNKNNIYKNTINNYKEIIISHKKYIKDLYQTKENLMTIYDNNINNLKNIIKSQNVIITKFKDSLKCSICYNKNINIILSPCNHCVMCDSCYKNYIKYDDTCPLCKTYINQYIKIFLPNLD